MILSIFPVHLPGVAYLPADERLPGGERERLRSARHSRRPGRAAHAGPRGHRLDGVRSVGMVVGVAMGGDGSGGEWDLMVLISRWIVCVHSDEDRPLK